MGVYHDILQTKWQSHLILALNENDVDIYFRQRKIFSTYIHTLKKKSE